ncbi:MAG: hypothetical protein Q8P12_01530 [bacterium]|nr:hypothetical protein [bacterium]
MLRSRRRYSLQIPGRKQFQTPGERLVMSFLVRRPKRTLTEVLLANLNKGNEEILKGTGRPMTTQEKIGLAAKHLQLRATEKKEETDVQ